MRALALALGVLSTGLAAAPMLAGPHRSPTSDAYILAIGDSWTSGDVDLGEIGAMRGKLAGDFLWFRRSGQVYRVDDPAVLAKAKACFDSLRGLEPEQDAYREREEAFDAKEESLEREIDDVETDLEDFDADTEAGMKLPESERDGLEARRDALEAKQREREPERLELEAAERELDAREEKLEAQAEARLWRLIDETIESGAAKKLSAAR